MTQVVLVGSHLSDSIRSCIGDNPMSGTCMSVFSSAVCSESPKRNQRLRSVPKYRPYRFSRARVTCSGVYLYTKAQKQGRMLAGYEV